MSRNNSLAKEVAFLEEDLRQLGVVCLVDLAAHVVGDNQGTVLLEKTLMVSQMVWVHLKVVAKVRKTCWARDLPNALAVDGDDNWVIRVFDV